MRGRLLTITLLIILGVNLFSLTPVAAKGNTPFDLSVKLTVVPPVTLNFLGPVPSSTSRKKGWPVSLISPSLPGGQWKAG